MIILIILLIIVALFLFATVKVVRQQTNYIIETFGKYSSTWQPGLHIKIPIIQMVASKVSLKEQVADFPPQSVITKDNVMLSINSVVYFKIIDPYKNTYGVENYLAALEKLAATSLRSIVGEMLLDECLSSRDQINGKMIGILDNATEPWGIDVTRVEIQDIIPPSQMQDAMERQATAERNKRAMILDSEGKKESAIRVAEGNKQAMILTADAEKEKLIREAEGKAQAVERVAKANAEAIKYLREAGADDKVITLKKLEAMVSVANGKATKIVVPSDLMNTVGITEIVGSTFKDSSDMEREKGTNDDTYVPDENAEDMSSDGRVSVEE